MRSFTLTRNLLVAAVVIVTTSVAFGQMSKAAVFGATNVQLTTQSKDDLKALGLHANAILPSGSSATGLRFPVVAGAIDLDTGKGEIIHSGGIALENEIWPQSSETNVRLQSFTIDTANTAHPVLTGLVIVNNQLLGGLPRFNLVLPSELTLPLKTVNGYVLRLNDVGLTLTSTAASALNGVYKTNALTGGFGIGTATVSAVVTSYKEN
jgi:hypothetical protein